MPSELTDPPRSARAQLARYALTTHLPLMALEGRRRRYIRRALADG
jgi:hypothetical protein